MTWLREKHTVTHGYSKKGKKPMVIGKTSSENKQNTFLYFPIKL